MNNIILSILITLLLSIPTLIGIFVYKWKKNIKFLFTAIIINSIYTIIIIFFTLTILNPSKEFRKDRFETLYSQSFKTELPTNIEYIATKYIQERGLMSNEFWTARIQCSNIFYSEFLKEIQAGYSNKTTNQVDKITGDTIKYTFKSRYMSGINYEIDFFEDNKTIRIYLIEHY
jgi:hypothetical protein